MCRLLAALVCFCVGYLWVRRWSAARFRRRLCREGLPPDLARALARDYRATLRFRDVLSTVGRTKR